MWKAFERVHKNKSHRCLFIILVCSGQVWDDAFKRGFLMLLVLFLDFVGVLGSPNSPICHTRSRNAAYSLPTSSSGLCFGNRAEWN